MKVMDHLQILIAELIRQKCSQEMQQGFLGIINHFVKFLQKDSTNNLSTCRVIIEDSLRLFFDTKTKMKLIEMESEIQGLKIEMLYYHLHFVRNFGNCTSHGCKTLQEYETISVISSTVCVLELLIANHQKLLKKLKPNQKQKSLTDFTQKSKQNQLFQTQFKLNEPFQTQFKQNQQIQTQFQTQFQTPQPNRHTFVQSFQNSNPFQFQNNLNQNQIQQNQSQQNNSKFKPMENNQIKDLVKEMRKILKNPPYSIKRNELFPTLSKQSQDVINNTILNIDVFLDHLCSNQFIVLKDTVSNCKVHVNGDNSLISDNDLMIRFFTENCGEVENYNHNNQGVAVVKFKTHDGFINAVSLNTNVNISPLQ
jgi:hypothetical protein